MFRYLKEERIVQREIPGPEVAALPGIPWGRPEVFFTPAYWMTQYWMSDDGNHPHSHRLGQTLAEETVACLLGGHGIPAEVGIAAFERLRSRGLIESSRLEAGVLSSSLREPLDISGRQITYRFWSQKAQYITTALRVLDESSPPIASARGLRQYLMNIPGIGPKTASWIVRNWLESDEVAILDIHIVRAGQLMNLYSANDRVESHYFEMERRFLDFCSAIEAPASDVDALIWSKMRQSRRLVARLLGLR
jgi:N-glycosylase/DNA lyase